MSNAPTCRNCLHAVWTLTPRGQIKQRTAGVCTAQCELLRMSEPHTLGIPCLNVRVVGGFIWPSSKAHKCPGFVRKGPVDP